MFRGSIAFGSHEITAMPAHWTHFHHGADVGVRGIGPSIERAFEQAAIALTAVVTDPQTVAPTKPVHITCEAPDTELLLADWLNALVYEMATRKMIFGRFEVHCDGNHLDAIAWGELVDVRKHEPAVEIKGATYTSLAVNKTENGDWLAQCVVDV